MVEAGRHGADFVECDVQLTKDRVPVIYHDFNVKVNLRKRVRGLLPSLRRWTHVGQCQEAIITKRYVVYQVLNNMDDMKDANFELCSMAVKDLTLKQLQSLQVNLL